MKLNYQIPWYWVLVFLINAIAILFLFDFQIIQYDTPSYTGGAKLLFNLEGGQILQYRIVKPSVLFFPGLLEYLFGVKAIYGFFIQAVLSYFLISIFLFKISLRLFKNVNAAIITSLLYLTAPPFLNFGFAMISDAFSWMMGIAGIYFVIKLTEDKSSLLKWILLGGFMAIGFTAKEAAAIAPLFLCTYILFDKQYNFIDKIKIYLSSGTAFLVVFGLINLYIYSQFGLHMFSWIGNAHEVTEGDSFKLITAVKQGFITLNLHWFVALLSIFSIIKNWKELSKKSTTLFFAIITGFGLTSLLLPIWPYFFDRFLFMLAPFVLLLTVFLYKEFKKWSFFIIIPAIIGNYIMSVGVNKYAISGLLSIVCISYLGYLILLIIFYFTNKNSK